MFNPPHGTNDKTMRTKTPKQLFEQWKRIAAHDNQVGQRAMRTLDIFNRYERNIYAAFGVDSRKCTGTSKTAEIWEHGAVPASIYAKQTEV